MTSTGAASRSGTAHAARADAGASARAAAASVTARRDIFPTDPPAFARVWAIDHAASVIAMRVVLLTITARDSARGARRSGLLRRRWAHRLHHRRPRPTHGRAGRRGLDDGAA